MSGEKVRHLEKMRKVLKKLGELPPERERRLNEKIKRTSE